MELYDAIRNRYSVRKYEDRDIEDDKLERVLEAGRIAPSARNVQPWKFIVVRDPETRAALVGASEQEWMSSAPVIIAIVGISGLEERIMYCGVPADPVDCAIAIDHMTLAAVAEGLGTCWIGHFRQDDCRKILGVPDEMVIIEMLTIGYPEGEPKTDKKRKTLDEVVCYEKYEA